MTPAPRQGRQFELRRELGRGTFGTVYLAEMASGGGFRKEVALKVLHPSMERQGDAATRLRDEARLLGRLRHRNIVQVDDLVRLDGRWVVVMEHIPGHDLEHVIDVARQRGVTLPLAAALDLLAGVASALDAAWSAQGNDGAPLRVIHRDIKPSNIRLTPQGEVKVLDFGIARADFSDRETSTGRVRFGSLAYMAPERLLDGLETLAGDMWALGCVGVELIIGERVGRAELVPDRHAAQIGATDDRLRRRLLPDHAGVRQLLLDLLLFDPDHRPEPDAVRQRARALARALPPGPDAEDLESFARRFLPVVDDHLGDLSRSAAGVFTEEAPTGSGSGSFPFTGPAPSASAAATVDLPQAADEAPRPRALGRDPTQPDPGGTESRTGSRTTGGFTLAGKEVTAEIERAVRRRIAVIAGAAIFLGILMGWLLVRTYS